MNRDQSDKEGTVIIGDLVSAVVGDFDWSIVEVWAQQGGNDYTLYTPTGGKKTVELMQGQNWELHVQWSCVNKNKGLTGWTACATMIASGVPTTYQRQSKLMNMEWASSFNNDFPFNMGAMPDGNVSISRIKFWATQAYTHEVPPDSLW
jgi:hypothetical protein